MGTSDVALKIFNHIVGVHVKQNTIIRLVCFIIKTMLFFVFFWSGSHAGDGWGKALVMGAWKGFSLASWCHLEWRRMLGGGQGRLQSSLLHPRASEQCSARLAAEAVRTDK